MDKWSEIYAYDVKLGKTVSGGRYAAIVQQFVEIYPDLTVESVRSGLHRYRQHLRRQAAIGELNRLRATQAARQTNEFQSVKERKQALEIYLGADTSITFPAASTPQHTRKVLAVGDIHGEPDPELARAIVAYQPDIIIFGGDTLNLEQASRWKDDSKRAKTRRLRKTTRRELAAVRALIEFLLEHTHTILYVMRGNHEDRLYKKLAEVLEDWMLDYFTDPLDLLVEGLGDRVRLVETNLDWQYPDGTRITEFTDTGYTFVVGDVLLSHMNYTGGEPGQAVLKLFNKWKLEWEQPFSLTHVRVLVQFHGHKTAMLDRANGWYTLVEPGMGGCMRTEIYKTGYKPIWKPGTQGFVSFTQVLCDGTWQTARSTVSLNRLHIEKFKEIACEN